MEKEGKLIKIIESSTITNIAVPMSNSLLSVELKENIL
jgi:hypothetical protein